MTELHWTILLHFFVALLAIPLVLERIPRNKWFGFRLPSALASDAAWYAANTMLGGLILQASGIGVATCIGLNLSSKALPEGQTILVFGCAPLVAAVALALLRWKKNPIVG